MSKLFEALVQAKREKNALGNLTDANPSQFDGAGTQLLETEMLHLYRSLHNIFPDQHKKVILFIGVKGGEGTSTIVSNLARIMANRLSCEVAILDANILHPTQHRLFGIRPTVGWDDVLRGTAAAENAFYQVNEDPLWIVPLSPASAGAVQVIDTQGIAGFFGVLRERFDLVLIDCAPTTAFPDSIALSRNADGVVLIIEAESTRWPVAEMVYQQITNAGARVIGIVLNKRRYYIPQFVYERL